MFEVLGWVEAEADAGGGAGGDDVARFEGHEAAEVGDDLGDVEDEVGGGAVLFEVAVYLEPHF